MSERSFGDFGKFTEEVCYEITNKVLFASGRIEDIKTIVVCDGKYEAMRYAREWILSGKVFFNVKEILKQYEVIEHTALVSKEIKQ